MRLPAAALALALALAPAARQQAPSPPAAGPPRDPVQRTEPVGTGVIRGRVVGADTGSPIRRANVTLSPMASDVTTSSATPLRGAASVSIVQPGGRSGVGPIVFRPRQAVTDARGAFEFSGLTPGRYRVMVSPGQYSAQYVGLAYGAKAPNGPFTFEPGTPVQLGEGQTLDKVLVALPRGAVISGRVTDENGDPMARVQVYTIFFPPGSARGQRIGSDSQTDDLGQFRLYGLNPGEYVVAAAARSVTFVPPNSPPETEDDTIGFMTTYYPGATEDAAAQRIRARAGAETAGIEIRMVQGRLFRISGSVIDSQGRPAFRSNLQLTSRAQGTGSSFGTSTDEQGQFRMRNIPPGTYRVIARHTRQDGGPRGPEGPSDSAEMGTVALTVASDVEGLVIPMGRGTTVTGQLVFEQGAPSPLPAQMRVMSMVARPEDTAGSPFPEPGMVTPDLTFTLKGLMGEYVLRAMVPNQYVKSVVVNGEDITDTPREFKSNDRVVITVTSRSSTLEGNVTDASGAAAEGAGVLVFAEDKESWRSNSSRTKRGSVDANGRFRVTGLMPGRYVIVAAPLWRLNIASYVAGPELFEELAKQATAVVLGEDEQRKIDLRLLEGSGQ